MFNTKEKNELKETKLLLQKSNETIDSIKNSVATIEFSPEGVILDANELLLRLTGYEKNEIIGKKHSVMCVAEYVKTNEYRAFWENLRSGNVNKGTFQRLNKQGESIWLEASYFPIISEGRVVKVMKIASDVTHEKISSMDKGFIANALNRSQAMIEFTPEGTIITANKNFTDTVHYDLAELKGKHHRILCYDEFYHQNPSFWDDLKRGQFKSGQFLRKDKYGNNVWLA